MSLSEKVIKNTYYYFFSQVISLLMPLFLTPFIIMKIGDTQFGIYTLILGVLGTFGLLDLSLSTSFIKFISEYLWFDCTTSFTLSPRQTKSFKFYFRED